MNNKVGRPKLADNNLKRKSITLCVVALIAMILICGCNLLIYNKTSLLTGSVAYMTAYTDGNNVRIRRGRSTESNIVTEIANKNTKITVMDYTPRQSWYKVKYTKNKREYKGYIHKSLVRVNVGNYNNHSNSFYGTALGLHSFIYDNWYWYDDGSSKKVPTDYYTNKSIDCSSYVSWALYEYGYTAFGGKQKTTDYFMDIGNTLSKNKSTKYFTKVNKSNIAAGDLIVYKATGNNGVSSDHIEIYSSTKNGQLYVLNAGRDAAIHTRYDIKSKYSLSKAKYIIRVKKK